MKKTVSCSLKKAVLLLLVGVMLLPVACMGEPTYTYEEYLKRKAFQQRQQEGTQIDVGQDQIEQELAAFENDLNGYELYIREFSDLYQAHAQHMDPLYDRFDGEQEDLDRKNAYAQQIKQHLDEWYQDLNMLVTADIMEGYHQYMLGYLENEIGYYESFLEGDSALAEQYMLNASLAMENGSQKLEAIESDLNQRAQQLGMEPPF